METVAQLALCVVPDYTHPRFEPGADVRAFLQRIAWAATHNRVLYEFACATGWPALPPPRLIDEARRALAYARIVRRFPAAENLMQLVAARREPVPTVALAVEIGASVRTAYNYAAALEAAGLLSRRSQKTGWIAERLN